MKRHIRFWLQMTAAAVLVVLSSCRKEESPLDPKPYEPPQDIKEFLESIPQISSVKELEDECTGFESKWELTFTQPLDHFDGSIGYKIPQKLYLHFKSYDAPVVFYGTGYNIMNYIPDVATLLDANVIEFEYRYFDTSIPDGMYPDVNWTYLTSCQASADLHAIYEAFKPAFGGKWVSSGVSKGGITSAFYARFYPDDMDLYLPFCAPFCMSLNDERIGKWISNGIATKEVREGMIAFIKMALRMQPELCAVAIENKYFKLLTLEQMALALPTYIISTFIQLLSYYPVEEWFGEIPTKDDEDFSAQKVFDFIIRTIDGNAVEGRKRNQEMLLALTKSGEEEELSQNPYCAQSLKELGYFCFDLTPYQDEVNDNLISEAYARFGDNMGTKAERAAITFSDTLMVNFFDKFLPKTDAKMIFVYGQNDIWTGAGLQEEDCVGPNVIGLRVA
ncbi:MAG: S28 family serine protease [Candidatus Cryptobacteroides sp.]